jgi:hypothetical protein
MERHLNDIGEWKIALVENSNDDQSANAFSKILAVEKTSWKETWRLRTERTVDEDLVWIWTSSCSLAKTNPDFRRKIWFLGLNNQIVAYSLVIQYKGTAFIAKTSYADQYSMLHLGLFVNNAVIKDLISKKEVQRIDFMTNLHFMKTWTSTCLPRVRFMISNGIIPNLFDYTVRNLIGKALTQNQLLSTLTKFTNALG